MAAALITSRGRILQRGEEPTCQEGPDPGIRQITRLLRRLLESGGLSAAGVQGVGIGIPAVLEAGSDHVVWAPNLAGWRDVALRSRLEEELGIPVYVEYDGHTAVLGEWWLGAGRGRQSVAMVIVGTGIGGGLILEGRLYRGHNRLAGAAGWFAMTSQPDLDDQRGQALGHWESLGAGPGIARRARSLLSDYPQSSLHTGSPETIDTRQIFTAARSGDLLALRVVQEAAGILGLGIANLISLINPEIVILGGGVGRQGDLLLAPIREVVLRWAQPASARSVEITTASLGSDAGLYGAAYAAIIRSEYILGTKGDDAKSTDYEEIKPLVEPDPFLPDE